MSKEKPTNPVKPPQPQGMVIMACPNGAKAIQSLCDAALKMGGLQNLRAINTILMSIQPLPEARLGGSMKPAEE